LDLFEDPVILVAPIASESPRASQKTFPPRLRTVQRSDGDLDVLSLGDPGAFLELDRFAMDDALNCSGHDEILLLD
jgi:hypothetical protein